MDLKSVKAFPWIVAASITVFLALLTLLVALKSPIPDGNLPLYYLYSEFMWHGAVPYKDLPIEYPPGVLPFILFPMVFGSGGEIYKTGFVVLACLAVMLVFWQLFKRYGKKAVWLLALLMLPVLQFVFYQLDVFAAVALFGALVLLKDGRYGLSALSLAGAGLIKGYPLICLPIILLYLPRPQIKKYMVVLSTAIAGGFLPFLIISPGGVWHSFHYHAERPAEILSGPAAVGFVLHAFGEPLRSFESHFSQALGYPHEHLVALVSSLLMVAGIVYIALCSSKKTVFTSCTAALVLFVLTFKVGSPQFIVPILFTALLTGEELGRNYPYLLARLILIGVALFMLLMNFGGIIELRPGSGPLVVVRIILVAELLIWLLRKLHKLNQGILKSRLRKLASYRLLI